MDRRFSKFRRSISISSLTVMLVVGNFYGVYAIDNIQRDSISDIITDSNSNTTIDKEYTDIIQHETAEIVVSIPDNNLKRALNMALGVSNFDADITNKQLQSLTGEIMIAGRDITRLDGIEYCTNITSISIENTSIIDITPLSKLTNLTELCIIRTPVRKIEKLEELINLEKLYIEDTEIININPLSKLLRLNKLSLINTRQGFKISDISSLSTLTNLIELELRGNDIPNISSLSNLTNLNTLYLMDNNISDITPLSNLTNLNKLHLGGNKINSIAALENLVNLTELALNHNRQGGLQDISPLKDLTNLESLILSSNNISDIRSLSNLTNLKVLRLNNNYIESQDLSILLKLKNLVELNLSSNSIMDISSLSDLSNLRDLKTLDVGTQRMLLPKAYSSNIFSIENFIKGLEGQILSDLVLTPNGKVTTNEITWENIESSTQYLYARFDEKMDVGDTRVIFNGLLTQEIEYREETPPNSGGSNSGNDGNSGGSTSPLPPSQKPIELTDINGHWSEKTIKLFLDNGYIKGYDDNTFKPDNTMTRAEFVKIVNKVFGFTEKRTELFKDVNENDWYYSDVCIAVRAGYIKGKSKDTFDPEGKITRQEVAMILTTIKNNKDSNLDKLNGFKDSKGIDDWAKSSVEGAVEAGYIGGYSNGTIRPKGNITRAEVVTMLSRVK